MMSNVIDANKFGETIEECNLKSEHETVSKILYEIPSFDKSLDYGNPYRLGLNDTVTFTGKKIRHIVNLFKNYPEMRNGPNGIRQLIGRFITTTAQLESVTTTVKNVMRVVSGLDVAQSRELDPYLYLLYARTPDEIAYMENELWDDHGLMMSIVRMSTETPLEQFKKMYPLRLKCLLAELYLIQDFATPDRMTNLIIREYNYLNEQEDYARERLTDEQLNKLVINIYVVRQELTKIANAFKIHIPDEVKYKNIRGESTFRFLKGEQQMENKESLKSNLRKVLENRDLMRGCICEYLH
jgi:hypothetical protein